MQVIAHNLTSMFTDRQLNISTKNKARATEKLSSGYRINRSADDAAGLQISEKLRWQIRGLGKASKNIQDGVSLLQVADGALGEVHDMLHRMKELSVQAANDTNTGQDREAIQQEVDALLTEINRIGSDTEFNERKIFQGGYQDVLDANGQRVVISQIPVSDLTLGGNSELLNYPFTNGSDAGRLNLRVSTNENYQVGASWNLVFGSGSTSHSNLKLTYKDDAGNDVSVQRELSSMPVSDVSISNDGKDCVRTYTYRLNDEVSVQVKQRITLGVNDGEKQYYNIEHTIINNGTKDLEKAELLFNVDTAYNNNDRCEEYYINGTKVDKFCMYTDNSYYSGQSPNNTKPMNQLTGNSFSIIDSENALSFSENVYWDTGAGVNSPETVLIGNYGHQTGKWDYYDNLSSRLGGSTEDRDIAFSMIWNTGNLAANNAYTAGTVHYGIHSTATDQAIKGVTIEYAKGSRVHVDKLDLWIQMGALNKSGDFITIGEMNTGVLGINDLNVLSNNNAGKAMSSIDDAVDKISKQRSVIGAQQNRLEHAMLVDDNTQENTQAAESRLRDTDMAEEMVNYSKHNILEQAGQSLLAQGNQSMQSVVTILGS